MAIFTRKTLIWLLLSSIANIAFGQISTLKLQKALCKGDSSSVLYDGTCTTGLAWFYNGSRMATNGQSIIAKAEGIYSAKCVADSIGLEVLFPKLLKPTVTVSATTLCLGETSTLQTLNCTGTLKWSTSESNQTITVSQKGKYWASCTNVCGEVAMSDTIVITSLQKPSSPLISANVLNLCTVEVATLSASACSGDVVWSNGAVGQIIDVYAEGNYTAKCHNNCGVSDASNTINIIRSRVAAPKIFIDKPTICNIETATLRATGCKGQVVWSSGDQGNQIFESPKTTTVYTAICVINGCQSEPSNVIELKVCNTPKPIAIGDWVWQDTNQNGIQDPNENGLPGVRVELLLPNLTKEIKITNEQGRYEFQNLVAGAYTLTVALPTGMTLSKANASEDKGRDSDIKANASYTFKLDSLSRFDIDAGIYKPNCSDQIPKLSTETILICRGEQAILKASGCLKDVQWSNGMLSPSISVSPISAESYTARCVAGVCKGAWADSLKLGVVVELPKPNLKSNLSVICSGGSVQLTAEGCPNGSRAVWSNGMTGNLITITATSPVSVTARCQNAVCKSGVSEPINIAIGTQIKPILSFEKALKCLGDSTVIRVSGCTSNILWSTGQTTERLAFVPLVNAKYSVSCTTSCGLAKSDTLALNLPAVLNAPKVKDYVAKCNEVVAISKVLKDSIPAGYSLVAMKENIPVPNILLPGTYQIKQIDIAGCISPAAVSKISFDTCLNESSVNLVINTAISKNPIFKGEDATLSIVVFNLGPLVADSVEVSFKLPEGIELASMDHVSSHVNGLALLQSGKMAIGDTLIKDFLIKNVNAAESFLIESTATAIGQKDGQIANNTSKLLLQSVKSESGLAGLALQLDKLTKLDNDRFAFDFMYTVKNYSDGEVKNLEINNDLAKAFGLGAVIETSSLKITAEKPLFSNLNFTGTGLNINLLDSDLSALPKGDSTLIKLTAIVNLKNVNATELINQATLKGKLGNALILDLSQDGSDPDPDKDKNPSNNNQATSMVVDFNNTVERLSLGLSMAVVDTVKVQLGQYRVTYFLQIKNLGNQNILNYTLLDSVQNHLGVPFNLVGMPFMKAQSKAVIDSSFNGTTNTRLVHASNILEPGKTDSLWFTIEVFADTTVRLGNQAFVYVPNTNIKDISNDGLQINQVLDELTWVQLNQGNTVFIPSGFSPNNDGKNDKWVFTSRQNVLFDVQVYNRWGALVYEQKNYENDFTGISNMGVGSGSLLPAGTYFYKVVEQTNQNALKTGMLIINY